MRKIIIIGGSSGIGEALARLYAANGDMVAITGRRSELLENIREAFPANIVTSSFDVMGYENIPHLQKIIDQLGGLDIFIYNSGYGEPSIKLDWKIDRQTTAVNVNGFIEMVNYAFNYFQQQGHGQIVATSSIASNRGNSLAPAYSASKAFMSTYMEGIHIKSKKLKVPIIITDIQPGFVNTKMAKGNKRFWVSTTQKAALQVFNAIHKKRFRVYVTKRWWLIAKMVKWLPDFIYHRIG